MKRMLCTTLALLLLGTLSPLAGAAISPDGLSTVLRHQQDLLHQRLLAAEPLPVKDSPFAAQLFEAAESKDPNRTLSPVSAQLALSLIRPGTTGATRTQLDTLLQGTTHSRWTDILQTKADGPTIEVANSLWFDSSVTPNRTYLNTVEQDFSAESTTLPLASPSALIPINQWVSAKTHGLIPTILDDPLPEEAAVLLLNALYFNGKWTTPFPKEATYDQTFHNQDGSQASVPFLHHTRSVQYVKTEAYTGAALPYQGDGSWWMLLLLPAAGTSPADLVGQDFGALLDSTQSTYTQLSLPKLNLQSSYDLTDALQSMGLTAPFLPGTSDLSPMGTCTKGPLVLTKVVQKTCLQVDELGTQAAAVTGAIAASSSAPINPPVSLTFDQPFLCCLWNDQLEQPLFLSAVNHLG